MHRSWRRPWRCTARTMLTHAESQRIVARAESYVGREYGWPMVIAHFLDWLLPGVYLFRRLVGSDNYPICSWIVAHAYMMAGKTFGQPGRSREPG